MKSFLQIVLIAIGMSSAIAANLPEAEPSAGHSSTATFAGGNFWYLEAVFESVKGVQDVTTGYAAATTPTAGQPVYAQVQAGTTGYAETVNIEYDSTKITYEDLLKIYLESMVDPAQINGQGADQGPQYKSYVFYHSAAQKKQTEDYLDKVNRSGRYKGAAAVQLLPFTTFHTAEADNQDYLRRHTDVEYVRTVAIPQLKKFQLDHLLLIEPDRKIQ